MMTNTEIIKCIDETYKTQKFRAILRDRLVEGMSYMQIANKHYKYALPTERAVKIVSQKVQRMEAKVYKAIEEAEKSKYGVHSEFDIQKHKATFVNYLEVNIDENGHVMYAVPSHQELAIQMACKAKGVTREELYEMCPPEYYCDFLVWLLGLTNSIAVWNDFYYGKANTKQKIVLRQLKDEEIYHGKINKE